jgi:hypothetical protein
MSLLQEGGLDEVGMQKWYRDSLRRFPCSHQMVPEVMGISAE